MATVPERLQGGAPVVAPSRPSTVGEAGRLDVAAVLALQRSAGNAAATAVIARTTAVRRRLQRQPDEKKVTERAYAIWEGKGRPEQTAEQQQADYYEAQRQIRIEERAYYNWQAKSGGGRDQGDRERTEDYVGAEKQLAAEAVAANAPANQVEKEAEAPKATVAPAEVKPPLPPSAASAKYVLPNRRGGGAPPPAAVVHAPPLAAALPPGWLADAQLSRFGFNKAQARWQRNLPDWNGFEVHISVNPKQGRFDEFHVKFDLPGTMHRVYYFYDVTGTPNWDKSTKRNAAEAALTEAGCPPDELADGLKKMDKTASDQARALANVLR